MISKYKGCMVGLACGDYLGAPVEFSMSREQVEHFFGGKKLLVLECADQSDVRRIPGHYTDDTSMALCLAESLVEKGFEVSDQFIRYRRWLLDGYNTPFGDKAYGVGQHTFKMLFALDENSLPDGLNHKEGHGGNGALMRCAPIGLSYHYDMAELKDKSFRAAIITHNNSDAAWSCVVLNAFIACALRGYNKKDFVRVFFDHFPEVPENISGILERFNDESYLSDEYDNQGYTLDTLRIALYSFFKTDDFEGAVTEAVFFGGDADTQGAVAGALAGAYYGYENLPESWVKTLINRDHIEGLAEKMLDKINFQNHGRQKSG